MNKKDEVISDKDLFKIKVKIKLKKVFEVYNMKKEILIDSVVDKMLSSEGYSDQPRANDGPVDKLAKYTEEHLDAESFVNLIDKIMNELDDRSYNIIDLIYIDQTCKDVDIYGDILDMSKSHYYHEKWKAQHNMYRKLMKNYKKL